MPEVLPSVHLIDLCFQGRRAAIAAYLLVGPGGQAALIETGPATTRAALLEGVRAAGVDPDGIADVLVTHIHLDHAGGAGALLRDDLPGARILVHPAGLPHLVDPGPQALLGDLHERLVLGPNLPDGHGEGGVGVVALHDRSAVDGQDVALGQPVVPRDPMDDHVIG